MNAPTRAITAATAAAALTLVGFWLPVAPAANAASEAGAAGTVAAADAATQPITIVVTNPGDYADGDTPIPGTLRAAFETVTDESQTIPGDYRVEVPASLGKISITEGLYVTLGPAATSFTLTGDDDSTTVIDFGGADGLYLTPESSLEQVTLSNVAFTNGYAADLGHMQQRTNVSNVTMTDFESFSFGSLVSDSMSDVNIDGAHIDIRTFDARPDPYRFDLSESMLQNAPMIVGLTGTADQAVTVTQSTLRDSSDSPALSLERSDAAAGVSSFEMRDTTVSDNNGGGVVGYFLNHATVTDTMFNGNRGEAALRLQSGINSSEASQFDLQGLIVTDNRTYSAPVTLQGLAKSVSIADSFFSYNSGSAASAGGVHAFLDASVPAADSTFTITNNTFDNNAGAVGGIMVERWLRSSPGAELSIDRTSFSNNEGQEGAGDLSIDGIYAGSTAKITNSTFENGSITDIEAGRAITYGPVLGGTATIENSTIALPQNDSPAIYGARFDADSQFAITHTTLTGGSIEVEGDRGPDLVGTVIDTENEPLRAAVNAGEPNRVESVFITTPATLLPTATVVTSADLALGDLAYNGGSTRTRLPGPDSVLLNAVPNSPLATDQRGISRPQGSAADAGAVEVQGATVALVEDLRVTEGEDAVIEVRRSGTSEAPTVGTARASDDSATAGVDYQEIDGSFRFEPGSDAESVRLVVPTVKRPGKQGDRTFLVRIQDTGAATTVGEPAQITVTIVDTDSGTGPGPKPVPETELPKPKPKPTTQLPNTGAEAGAGIWFAVAFAAILAGGGILLARRRRN
ncbi:choice-of-anchor Q domain-containing protein [Leucobacter sp. 1207-22]|uniref:choice-of-anchor Q domain-containing protein n=1 Tax=Leucobacter sp. 1207-22 TaxID=2604456 RepID=UPI0040630980